MLRTRDSAKNIDWKRGNRKRYSVNHMVVLFLINIMEEPGRLQSMGPLRVRHDWATSPSLFTFMHWRRKWQPTPVFLPGESQGWGSLVGRRLWGRTESDTTEQLPFNFSLSCTGEGNGNPLQCSCLENLRDGGAWWAFVYGVAQSRTQLKQLSSSRSSRKRNITICNNVDGPGGYYVQWSKSEKDKYWIFKLICAI